MPIYGSDVKLNNPAYIHDTALIYGKVDIEEGVSVWPYVVMRAENQRLQIGRFTNIQDHVMIHIGFNQPTIVGDYCSITHHCTLHGCTIGNNVLIGINSTIMDGCVIGDNCIIAGHTILKEGTVIPDNSIVMGSPGKVKKTNNNFVANRLNAMSYYNNGLAYGEGNYRAWTPEALASYQESMLAEVNAAYTELYG